MSINLDQKLISLIKDKIKLKGGSATFDEIKKSSNQFNNMAGGPEKLRQSLVKMVEQKILSSRMDENDKEVYYINLVESSPNDIDVSFTVHLNIRNGMKVIDLCTGKNEKVIELLAGLISQGNIADLLKLLTSKDNDESTDGMPPTLDDSIPHCDYPSDDSSVDPFEKYPINYYDPSNPPEFIASDLTERPDSYWLSSDNDRVLE